MNEKIMRTTNIYRAETEAEAQEIIDQAAKQGGDLTKKIVELRQKKSKGEVIAEAYKVTVQIDWNTDFWSVEKELEEFEQEED